MVYTKNHDRYATFGQIKPTSSSLNHIRFSDVSTNQNSFEPPLNMLMLYRDNQPLRITYN
jgi:hypothetical protein